MATVDINRNQITRLKNSLKSLERCVSELEEGIKGKATYQENVDYLDENIYMLTSLIQSGIQEYIYVETTNFDNVRAGLDAQNARTFTVCSLISMAAIIVSILLTVNASRSVTRPIQKLCSVTQKVAEGDFTVKTKVENTDEISVLTQSFNDMTEEIGVLVEDIKKKQANLHIAETKLLQAQINPHFLYNTLDTIVWLAEENKKEEVVSMVTALSEFFRTTLSKGRDFITVKEEESHVESYLKIQQFRYQDIMDYEINIDESMYGFVIPKLTLQPLVENALYHGVKNKRGKGMIRITGRLKGGDMIFNVIDDGKGMTEEELLELTAYIEYFSNHPISMSLQKMYKKEVEKQRIEVVQEIPGQGIYALIDGKAAYAGNRELLRELRIAVPKVRAAGTIVYVALDGVYAGYIVIGDTLKKEVRETMDILKRRYHKELVMLTGDNEIVGGAVGKLLNMDHIYTNLLPAEKVEKVEEFIDSQQEDEKLVYVGDGINDAPVLKRADIGIAMGTLGAAAAVEAADIVLMEDDPSMILVILRIARETIGAIRQNAVLSIGMKLILLTLAATGLISMWTAITADVIIMLVTLFNALCLLKYPG